MTAYAESAARFARETPNHEMTVLHSDGLYRHLKFAAPGGGFYRFDIVTWPHNLFLRGDGFSFGFAIWPTEDMFDVFRGSRSGGINLGYWQEKVTAGQVKGWSEDLFRAWVLDEAAKAEARYPGAVEAVGKQILHSDEHSLEYQGTAEYALANFSHKGFRLRFPNEWEKDFQDYSWEFLFACHAVLFGIDKWDAIKTPALPSEVEYGIRMPGSRDVWPRKEFRIGHWEKCLTGGGVLMQRTVSRSGWIEAPNQCPGFEGNPVAPDMCAGCHEPRDSHEEDAA